MNTPTWKKQMYAAERESIKGLLVTFFSDYLTRDGLPETDYTPGVAMSETDKLFALCKLYFRLSEMQETSLDDIANKSIILALRCTINETIEKHFKEKSE